MALEIKRHLEPEDKIVVNGKYEIGSTLNYYTGRELYVFNGHDGNLSFGLFFPGAPNMFLDDQSFVRLWNGPNRVFFFTEDYVKVEVLQDLDPNIRICVCSRRREDHLYESPAWSVSLSFRADRTTNRGPSYVLMSRVRYNQYWRKRDASMA